MISTVKDVVLSVWLYRAVRVFYASLFLYAGGKTQEDFSAFLGGNKGKMVVFYCGFVKRSRSHNGAAWAKKFGYTNVYRNPGGIFAWKGAGYKTEKVKQRRGEGRPWRSSSFLRNPRY